MLYKFKRTTLITLACGAFLVGLWLAHVGVSLPIWGVVVAVLLLAFGWRRKLWPVTLTIAVLLLGVARGEIAVKQAATVNALFGQKVQLVGTVSDDPVYTDKNYTEFSVRSQLPGEVKIRTHYIRLHRGYRVAVEGKLEQVLGSKTAQIGFASSVNIISTQQSWLERIRQSFFAGMRTALPEPLSSFGLGLLAGTRGLIPRSLQDQLVVVGLSHLIAVSGYNLTILVNAVRFNRGSAFVKLVLPLWLIAGFCVVSGFSASIVRAAVVSILSLLALHYGRRFNPMVLLGLAAVITTLWQPSYLWADLGWQLSFLAFFGILVAAPAVLRRFDDPHPLLALAAESLAAQIMTAPLIIAVFGSTSLVAPLTNLLILPLVPLAMLVGMAAGLAGMLLPQFAPWIGLPANWLLQAMVGFIERASGITWASVQVSLSPPLVIAIYGLIVALVLLLGRRYNGKSKQAEYSDVGALKVEHNQA